MKAVKLIGLSIALIIGTYASAGTLKAKAVKGDWEKLGAKVVSMKADHDVITVSYHEGFYTQVKFAIRKAPIHLLNAHIIFGNGEHKDVIFNKRFNAGTSTRLIDLPGNRRIIKQINLNYKSISKKKGKALIIAWGKH